nr:lysine-rich arabinogalactan protein 19-like [Aegilops tauschii subsp. strangulata]
MRSLAARRASTPLAMPRPAPLHAPSRACAPRPRCTPSSLPLVAVASPPPAPGRAPTLAHLPAAPASLATANGTVPCTPSAPRRDHDCARAISLPAACYTAPPASPRPRMATHPARLVADDHAPRSSAPPLITASAAAARAPAPRTRLTFAPAHTRARPVASGPPRWAPAAQRPLG